MPMDSWRKLALLQHGNMACAATSCAVNYFPGITPAPGGRLQRCLLRVFGGDAHVMTVLQR